MARLSIVTSGNNYLCGAGLLNDSFAVSAAHCVVDPSTGAVYAPVTITLYAADVNAGTIGANLCLILVIKFYMPWSKDFLNQTLLMTHCIRSYGKAQFNLFGCYAKWLNKLYFISFYFGRMFLINSQLIPHKLYF